MSSDEQKPECHTETTVTSNDSLEKKVHSANDWENADLGDKDRKEKFLKLMGASKTDHKGKIVIGDSKAKHKGDDPSIMNEQLENQFQQGLEHKLKSGYKGHMGLGFKNDEPKDIAGADGDKTKPSGTDSPSLASESAVDAKPDTDIVEERQRVIDDEEVDNQKKQPEAQKHKSADEVEKSSSGEPAVKKKPTMNFVKASDS